MHATGWIRHVARHWVVMLVATTLLAACGGGSDSLTTAAIGDGGGTGGTGTGGTGGTGSGTVGALPTKVDYAAIARPLDLTPVLDATAVQQLDVPLGGGTLTVVAADGTRFTLSIPDKALRSATRVRMQAWSALPGMPAGVDAVHGVQLEPAGLQLLAAATLTIETVATVPVAQQAFIAYDGAGKDIHPVPGELGASTRLKLMHFSGYGEATLAREKSVSSVFVDVVPTGTAARLEAASAAALMQARDGTITEAQAFALVLGYLDQYEKEVLGPMRAAAAQSCANAMKALTADLGSLRQRALLGASINTDGATATMATLRTVCFADADKRCRVSGNIEELVVAHLALERQAQLLGANDPAATAAEETAIDKCGRFELQFDSTLTYDAISSIGFGRLSVATRVPLKLAADISQGLEGAAPIDYTDTTTRLNCGGLGCSYYKIIATHADTSAARKGLPRFAPLQGMDVWALGQPVAQSGTFSLGFAPGTLGEDIDVMQTTLTGIIDTNQFAGLPPMREGLWSGFYGLVNQNEIGADGWYQWDLDWTQGTYPVMFERSKAPSLDTQLGHFIAITSVKLVHKPI